jgi:glutamate dehydrogenase (NAD(P)+)
LDLGNIIKNLSGEVVMTQAERSFSSREMFLDHLNDLKDRFAAMQPELEVTVRDPSIGLEGYVVVWNTKISAGGPLEFSGKGGTRTLPTLSLDEIKMLARNMAIKNAAAGLPLGGAKSGLRASSDAPDFERTYRRFVSLCKPFLHENGGVFGGFGFDIGSKPVHALWACDELQSRRSFTGKPVDMGGTDYDREGIAGLGVAVAGQSLLEVRGEDVSKITFAVQGMGAMGAAVFRYFSETGARLAAMSDPKYGGTWVFDKMLSPELHKALVTQDAETAKKLLQLEATLQSDDVMDALYAPVDIIFPCAVQDVIRPENVAKIQARYMSEGANKPTQDSAQDLLFERGILVVPDFIANPGGIIAAFVELTSQSNDKVAEAKAMTRQKIPENVRMMMELVAQFQVTPQQAGLYMALSKILEA